MTTLAFSSFEKALNHYLNLDPKSRHKIAKLQGKTLKLYIKPIVVFFCFEEHKVCIKQNVSEENIIATLEGYPLAFIQLHFSSKENAPKLFKQDLSITGDIQFGQEVRDLFQTIDIDWEEYLSHFTGDIIAHEAIKFLNHTSRFAQKIGLNLQQSLTEYLQEEAKHLPTKEEIDDFCDDIDHLTLRADRLQARLDEKL